MSLKFRWLLTCLSPINVYFIGFRALVKIRRGSSWTQPSPNTKYLANLNNFWIFSNPPARDALTPTKALSSHSWRIFHLHFFCCIINTQPQTTMSSATETLVNLDFFFVKPGNRGKVSFSRKTNSKHSWILTIRTLFLENKGLAVAWRVIVGLCK